MQIFEWLQTTTVARALGEFPPLTAWLSAAHAIGFTLVMSGGVVWNLWAAGLLLGDQPAEAITRPAVRLLLAGLTISLITGLILFAPRAPRVAESGVFQLKMALLLIAAAFQLAMHSTVIKETKLSVRGLHAAGSLGLILWLSLAVTACWFILFE